MLFPADSFIIKDRNNASQEVMDMAESKRAAAAKASNGAEEKAKALETALAQIKKQFGEGAVMRLGQDSALNVEAIPTGSLSLDLALGIGGMPSGCRGPRRKAVPHPPWRPHLPCRIRSTGGKRAPCPTASSTSRAATSRTS